MNIIENWKKSDLLAKKNIIDLLNEIKLVTKIHIKVISGSWIDIDTLLDLKNANSV